jgi:hypothetical protein
MAKTTTKKEQLPVDQVPETEEIVKEEVKEVKATKKETPAPKVVTDEPQPKKMEDGTIITTYSDPIAMNDGPVPETRNKILTRQSVPFRKGPTLMKGDIIGHSTADGVYVVLQVVNNSFGKFYRLPADRYVFAEYGIVEELF